MYLLLLPLLLAEGVIAVFREDPVIKIFVYYYRTIYYYDYYFFLGVIVVVWQYNYLG